MPRLTVAENIFLGIEPSVGPFLKRGEMRRRSVEALTQIGLGDLDPATIVGELSNATAKDIEKLFALIRTLKGRGMSIVYISHFLEEIAEITDRFTVLRDGQTVGKGVTADTEADQIIALMVGRDVKDLYPRSPRTTSAEGLAGAAPRRGLGRGRADGRRTHRDGPLHLRLGPGAVGKRQGCGQPV